MLLLERTTSTDRTLTAESQETAEIGIGRQHIKCRLATVVDAFSDPVAVADHLHVGIFLFKIGNREVSPLVMERHRQRADINDVFALAAHLLRQKLGMRLAITLRRDHLEIPRSEEHTSELQS